MHDMQLQTTRPNTVRRDLKRQREEKGGGGGGSEAEGRANRVEELLDDGLLLGEPRAAADGDGLDRLDPDERLDADAEEGNLGARGGREESEDGQAPDDEAGGDLELRRAPLVIPAVIQEGELHGEEDRQDRLQDARHHAGVVEVLREELACLGVRVGVGAGVGLRIGLGLGLG